VTIRGAFDSDRDRLLEMAAQFVADSSYRAFVGLTSRQVEEHVEMIWRVGAIFVAEVDGQAVGMIGGLILPNPIVGERWAYEMAWWVDPEHRGRGWELVERLEAWARDRGALRLQLVAPEGSGIGTIYRRKGYAPIETAYVKELARAA
jgi:GNAT superfamily N-acetyltransferase